MENTDSPRAPVEDGRMTDEPWTTWTNAKLAAALERWSVDARQWEANVMREAAARLRSPASAPAPTAGMIYAPDAASCNWMFGVPDPERVAGHLRDAAEDARRLATTAVDGDYLRERAVVLTDLASQIAAPHGSDAPGETATDGDMVECPVHRVEHHWNDYCPECRAAEAGL